MASTLSEKVYYKIGEVATVAGVKTSVLRFWESEFLFLKPSKSSSGQRLYSRDEVELVLQVKHLLYNEKYTIEGVRKRITSKGKVIKSNDHLASDSSTDYRNLLKLIQSELKLLSDSI
jgi:DNA-binding transcriptional MerR regulator